MIERLHPITIFCYFLCTIGFSMCSRNPVFLGISFACALFMFLTWFLSEQKQISITGLITSVVFFVVILVINPLFYHNGKTVLFYLNQNRITLEALIYGAVAAEMLMSVFLWCRSLSHYMTREKVLLLFGHISKKGALVFSMILHFVPEYKKEFVRRKEAQQLLGLYGNNTFLEKVKGNVMLFSSVTDYAFEHSVVTADSMTMRGYEMGKRSFYTTARLRRVDLILIVLMLLLSPALIVCLAKDAIAVNFYPVFEMPKVTFLAVLSYVLFGIICLILPIYGVIKRR